MPRSRRTPEPPDETEVSRHWQRLGGEHIRALEAHGAENIKRHQALRYFTWRWSWRRLWRSEQFRFLLRHSSPRTLAAVARAPVDLSQGQWEGVEGWPRRDRWLYVFAVRLLWEYARGQDSLGVLELDEPSLGNPLPVHWRGRLISQDLANSALEANAIGRALGDRPPATILEIGAGYGRLTHALLGVFGDARATVIDIEPALTISSWYLSNPVSPEHLRFLGPPEAAELPTDRCRSRCLSAPCTR